MFTERGGLLANVLALLKVLHVEFLHEFLCQVVNLVYQHLLLVVKGVDL